MMLGTCNNCAHLNWVVADDSLYYCGFIAKRIENLDCECKAWKSANKSMTNADRIRSMTDEELAKWLNNMQGYSFGCGLLEARISEYPNCYNAWLEWLKDGKA